VVRRASLSVSVSVRVKIRAGFHCGTCCLRVCVCTCNLCDMYPLYACMYVFSWTFECVKAHAHINTHTHIHDSQDIHVHKYTCTHTYTSTHIHVLRTGCGQRGGHHESQTLSLRGHSECESSKRFVVCVCAMCVFVCVCTHANPKLCLFGDTVNVSHQSVLSYVCVCYVCLCLCVHARESRTLSLISICT
jgi:hypothetical protein